ncbi:lysylphosphatidylglycerol synthase transmembrane domain-containing protein [Nocardioides aromaticivorans]|uniref:lysylphosphatidylglycerol synthase transmembrane domain-containing protein n=1 Tax=Nocardioides aromaticivorans TaxID=200618 RepID=UPI001A8C878F|nr:lysylphosphatidylglycerol synthase transmembrane domain-containing protein [Nocardioides aromaticivorans]
MAGAAVLAVLLLRVGPQPFLDGLARTDPRAIAYALVVTAATTACCARRWSLVAGGLGVGLPFGAAYRACYRAQVLNATLPGGVAGDVHRGYRHGRDAGALGRGLRSVVWDRASGQAVQVALAVACVPLLPHALRGWVLGVLAFVVLAAVVVLVAARREARAVLGGAWAEVVLLSALAAAGHVSVFVVAARTAGVTAPGADLAALALVVLLASAIPLGIAGWGPREGAAAAAFGAAGLGAATGVEVAVVFGILSLVATLPGLLVLRSVPTTGPERAKGGRAWASTPTSS